jgi:hypothetical protein
MRKLDELQARGTTRELAKRISTFTRNLNAFLFRSKEGAKVPQISPIVIDYLIGAYFTGLMQYPFDILNAQLQKKPLEGETPTKREDQADFSSFENALSIVTRRFKVASPIKNSQYHKEWRKIIDRAKKLKQIDISQMDLEKRNESFLIGLFGRITENLKGGMPAGTEPEVLAFSAISPILTQVETELRNLRTEKNNIINSPLDGDKKKEILDVLLSVENQMLKVTLDSLAEMDIEFIFDQTFTDNVKELGVFQGTLSSLIFGTAENAFKKNPREIK